MAKLVILTQGLNGRAHELNVDRTTIGRVEDNMFQIAESSVSSHHCEVLLRGSDIVIKDLNSTNGTFINDEQITERVLKPGQTLRLGQVELKLETEKAASAPATAPAPGPAKKQAEATMVIPRGVSLSELEGGGRPPGFDTSKEFSKKRNRGGIYFWIGVGIVGIIIVVLLLTALSLVKAGK
ncbi:MAG: FHA domain-containing protein [Verrucomicrobiota bacterium]|jgi:pSer/pThr/pTyr-binding forkhead associated (FHA) protein